MGIHDETIRAILQEKEEEIALLELAFPGESKTLWNLETVQFEKDTFIPNGESENRFDTMLSVEALKTKIAADTRGYTRIIADEERKI